MHLISSAECSCFILMHMCVQEDHMPSYFLAETCKYAFLTADSTFWKVMHRPMLSLKPNCVNAAAWKRPSTNTSILPIPSWVILRLPVQANNYIFTTEGHPIPIGHPALHKPVQAPTSPSPVPTQDATSAGLALDAVGATSAGGAGQETDCLQMNEAGEQQHPPESSVADVSPAVVQKGSRAKGDSDRPRPLLPSALDRRICPEPVQVKDSAVGSHSYVERCLPLLATMPTLHSRPWPVQNSVVCVGASTLANGYILFVSCDC